MGITYFTASSPHCCGLELCDWHLAKGLEQNRSLTSVKLDGSEPSGSRHQELCDAPTPACTGVQTLDGGSCARTKTKPSGSLAAPLLLHTKYPTRLSSVRTRPVSYWSRKKCMKNYSISLMKRPVTVVLNQEWFCPSGDT